MQILDSLSSPALLLPLLLGWLLQARVIMHMAFLSPHFAAPFTLALTYPTCLLHLRLVLAIYANPRTRKPCTLSPTLQFGCKMPTFVDHLGSPHHPTPPLLIFRPHFYVSTASATASPYSATLPGYRWDTVADSGRVGRRDCQTIRRSI